MHTMHTVSVHTKPTMHIRGAFAAPAPTVKGAASAPGSLTPTDLEEIIFSLKIFLKNEIFSIDNIQCTRVAHTHPLGGEGGDDRIENIGNIIQPLLLRGRSYVGFLNQN